MTVPRLADLRSEGRHSLLKQAAAAHSSLRRKLARLHLTRQCFLEGRGQVPRWRSPTIPTHWWNYKHTGTFSSIACLCQFSVAGRVGRRGGWRACEGHPLLLITRRLLPRLHTPVPDLPAERRDAWRRADPSRGGLLLGHGCKHPIPWPQVLDRYQGDRRPPGGFGHYHYKSLGFLHLVGKRSVDQQQQQEAPEILSMVAQLDPQGCLLKLLCHLEAKEAEALSRHEVILAGLFRDASDAATPSSAAFTYAVGIGNKSRDAAVCDKVFSKCPLKYSQLSAVLEESWACPIGDALQN
ncbi:uncharacterized protein LOC135115656 [Scylla paramamosain]|uniref:uncharacterized protein LOC135115656 n=1 Tax=Scylla paramamosain TaxID=85552 RepID=UPI003082B1BF